MGLSVAEADDFEVVQPRLAMTGIRRGGARWRD
jgi:hypothetical protein